MNKEGSREAAFFVLGGAIFHTKNNQKNCGQARSDPNYGEEESYGKRYQKRNDQ
jgi:hypothetical protein